MRIIGGSYGIKEKNISRVLVLALVIATLASGCGNAKSTETSESQYAHTEKAEDTENTENVLSSEKLEQENGTFSQNGDTSEENTNNGNNTNNINTNIGNSYSKSKEPVQQEDAGYAKAFKILCELADLECDYVTGTAMVHMHGIR